MTKKITVATCLNPDLVKYLKQLKKEGRIKSLSEAIREAVKKSHGSHEIDMTKQNTIDKYTATTDVKRCIYNDLGGD